MKKRMTRRAFSETALAAAAASALALRSAPGWAQPGYPTRPVRVILPFAAGGQADIISRLVAERLSEKLGQRFVIENQAGPGGIVAARSVLSAAPDGYTLGLATNGTSISVAIYNALPFDPVKDFVTISTLGYFDLVFATNSGSPFATLPDFIKAAREQPGKLNIGTIAVGSTQELGAELFKASAKLDVQIVPYRGTPDVIVGLFRNDVQLMVDFYAPMELALEQNRIRAVATSGMQAHRISGGRAGGRRSRRSGLRGDGLERIVRAEQDLAGDRRALEPHGAGHSGAARHQVALRSARHRSQGQHARGAQIPDAGRHRQMGGGDRARRHSQAIERFQEKPALAKAGVASGFPS